MTGYLTRPTISVCVLLFLFSLFTPSAGFVHADPHPLAPSFVDVENHWARDTILIMQQAGIISGVDENRFAPDQPVTRLDFTLWMLRLLGEQPADVETLDFSDAATIPRAYWGDVARAVEIGLLQGFPDGTFQPQGPVTRIQLATILGRSLMELGVRAESRYFLLFPQDYHQIPDWALPAAAAVRQRLIVGKVAYSVFAPHDLTTRAEAVTMLKRFIGEYQALGGATDGPDLNIRPPERHIVAGWYMGRDEYRGDSYQTVQREGNRINLAMMSSYAFHLHEDGYVVAGGYDSPALFNWARNKSDGYALFRITNDTFCRETAREILHNPRHVERALDVIEQILGHGYDGVDINFENVAPSEREALTQFMAALRQRLGNRYLITMPVPAKLWDGPNHWFYAYDYAGLARHVDYLMPMAYDQHWSTGSPGPVAAAWWVENVVRYTLTQVPAEKVLLGVPFYGYDWLDIDQPNRARALTWPAALRRAQEAASVIEWSSVHQVPYFRYNDEEGRERIVYFEDERSLRAKLELITEYGLAGVAFWRFGQEAPEAWSVIRQNLR